MLGLIVFFSTSVHATGDDMDDMNAVAD